MSTPILAPSSLEEPSQFSISLPFDFDESTKSGILLACSAAFVALGHSNHIYVYSLPTFDLVHVLELAKDTNQWSLRVQGEILIVIGGNESPEALPTGCTLYIWDLLVGRRIETVMMTDYWPRVGISTPGSELVEVEEDGEVVGEVWPRTPTLIIFSPEANFLRTYTLNRSVGQSTEHSVTEAIHEDPYMLPVMTMEISPDHQTFCHASIGRTAITGGGDGTVRIWDTVTGEFIQVLIGHRSRVIDVRLDSNRIYSSSGDRTARIWDRHRGDCLLILNFAPFHSLGGYFLRITQSYILTIIAVPEGTRRILAWDSASGQLLQQIVNWSGSCIGPLRLGGAQRTLVTREIDEGPDSAMDWLKIWDVESGRMFMSILMEPDLPYLPFCCQGRFLVAAIRRDRESLLKVWDFGANGSVDVRATESQRLTVPSNSGREKTLETDKHKNRKEKGFIDSLLWGCKETTRIWEQKPISQGFAGLVRSSLYNVNLFFEAPLLDS